MPGGKNQGKANKADILLGVCYRPPSQAEEVGELFHKQLEDVPGPPALALGGDFNLPDNSRQQRRGGPGGSEEENSSRLVSELSTVGPCRSCCSQPEKEGLVGHAVLEAVWGTATME